MAKGIYIGNSNARKVSKLYVGNGTSHKVKKGYIGVGNTARLFYSSGYVWKKYQIITGDSTYTGKSTIRSLASQSGIFSMQVYVPSKAGIAHEYVQDFVGPDSFLELVYLDGSGTLKYNRSGGTHDWFTGGYAQTHGSRGDAYQAIVLSKFVSTPRTLAEFAPVRDDSDSNARDVAGSITGSGNVYMLTIDHNGSSSPYWRYAIHQITFSPSYSQGSYIGEVESERRNSYPDNGRHIDGYWYVFQGEA